MSILNRFIPSFQQRSGGARISELFTNDGGAVSSFEKWLIDKLGNGGRTKAGIDVDVHSAMASTAVWCATSIRSEALAVSPLNVYRKMPNGKRVIDDTHYLYPLLNTSPNKDQTSYEWKEMAEMHLCYRGNAFSQILRKGTKIIGLYPLYPDRMRLLRNADGTLTYWYSPAFGQGEGVIPLQPSQVLHMRGKSLDGLWGISPIQACAESIGVDLAAAQYGGSFFANAARPSGTLELDGELEEAEFESLKKRWREGFKSGDASSIAFLEHGVQFKPLSITNDEAQFLETRKFQAIDIGSRIYKVPPVFMGDYADAHFATMEQAAIFFIKQCAEPEMKRISSAMTRSLLTPEEQLIYEIGFDSDCLEMVDSNTKATTNAIKRQWGWASINDIRAEEDDAPVPGGDTYDAPLNMVPISFDRAGFYEKKQTQSTQNTVAGGVGGNQGQNTELDKDVPKAPKESNSTAIDDQKAAFRAIFTDYFARILRKKEAFLSKNGSNEERKAEFNSKHSEFSEAVLKQPFSAVCALYGATGCDLRSALQQLPEEVLSSPEASANALIDYILTEKEGT